MTSKQNPSETKRRAPAGRQKGRPSGGGGDKVGSDKVVETARGLLRQPRAPQITRAEVAKAAGVDEKLVRYYFGDYEDLLDQVVDLSIADLETVMTEASLPRRKASHVVRERVRALTGFLAENPTFFKLLVDRVYSGAGRGAHERLEALTRRAFERHSKVIAAGRANGEFRRDFDPRFLYIAIIGMAELFTTGRPVVEILFGEDANEVRGRYEKFVVDLIMRGIRASDAPD